MAKYDGLKAERCLATGRVFTMTLRPTGKYVARLFNYLMRYAIHFRYLIALLKWTGAFTLRGSLRLRVCCLLVSGTAGAMWPLCKEVKLTPFLPISPNPISITFHFILLSVLPQVICTRSCFSNFPTMYVLMFSPSSFW